MEAASRFELEIKALQASALPLGEAAVYAIFFCLERETGFEPATSTLARLHSTAELLPLDETLLYITFICLSTKKAYFFNVFLHGFLCMK